MTTYRAILLLLLSTSLVTAFGPKSINNHAIARQALPKTPSSTVLFSSSPSVINDARLFSWTADGTEVNGLLPPLGRRLDLGIGCYFEESDRPVRRLQYMVADDLHYTDACWALEACRGNPTEAFMRIAAAKRFKKRQEQEPQQDLNRRVVVDLNSYDAVPLELMFRRHLQKNRRRKTRRKSRRKKSGGILIKLAFFLGLCRYTFEKFPLPL